MIRPTSAVVLVPRLNLCRESAALFPARSLAAVQGILLSRESCFASASTCFAALVAGLHSFPFQYSALQQEPCCCQHAPLLSGCDLYVMRIQASVFASLMVLSTIKPVVQVLPASTPRAIGSTSSFVPALLYGHGAIWCLIFERDFVSRKT